MDNTNIVAVIYLSYFWYFEQGVWNINFVFFEITKTYSVEEAANTIMDMSSPSEFDGSLDSIKPLCEDSSWDEASTTSEIGKNEGDEI